MKTLKQFLRPVLESVEFAWQVSRYALIFVSAFFRQRTSLGCEMVAIRVSSPFVGSEEARLRAGLRPPLKLLGRFSRKQLSQRLSDAETQQKELPNQVNKPVLAVKRRGRQSFPTAVAPTLVSMRPDPPQDPTVETVKESSDVGSFVIFAPTPQKRIKFLDQPRGSQRHVALSA